MKVEISGIGEFEFKATIPNSLDLKADLKLMEELGSQYEVVANKVSELSQTVRNKIIQEKFPGRTQESLNETEREQLQQSIGEYKGPEMNQLYALNRPVTLMKFTFLFPGIAEKVPDGFELKTIDTTDLERIYNAYRDAADAASKKKS